MRKFDDPRTQNLANEIERQYGNLRKFSQRIEIPYSSLVSMLNNGAYTMSYGTMLKICMLLELDPIDFTPLTGSRSMGEHLWRNRLWMPFPGSTRREKKGYGASGNLCTDRKVYSIIFPGSRRRKAGTGSIGGGATGTGRLLGIDSHLTKPLEAKIQLKNLKVSWKLFISYAVLLVLLVAGCAVSIAHLAGLGKQIETFYEGPFIVNDSANIVNSNFERMQKAVYRAIANSDPEITAEAIANARDSAAIIQEQLPVIKEHFLGDKDIITRLEAALTELEPMRKNVLELATLNRREEAADYMEHNNILVIKKAQAELELLIESGKTRGNSLVDGLRSRQRKAVVTLFLLGSISVAVSIVLVYT